MNRRERESITAQWRETNLPAESRAGSLSPSIASEQVRQSHDARMLECRVDSQPTAFVDEPTGNAPGRGASVRGPLGGPVHRVAERLCGHARRGREVRQPVGGSRSVIRCYSE